MIEMTDMRTLLALACIMTTGCASMSNLKYSSPSARRNVCQAYVDDSASFIGQQQGWGIAFAATAVTTATAGAAVSNSDSGGAWKENKKTILLTAAVPAALLAYNFLSNASSATTSAATASIALADKDDDAMWAGCQRARAGYWDGRTAGIAAAASGVGKSQGTPATPQGREDAGNAAAAEAAAEKAANAAATAQKEVDAAKAAKDPTVAGLATAAHYTAAQTAAGEAKKAADAAKAALAALKAGSEEHRRRVSDRKGHRGTPRFELLHGLAARSPLRPLPLRGAPRESCRPDVRQ